MNVAHGLGGGSDLPIPASFAVLGGTAALALSFVILLFAWREPRFTNPRVGRTVPVRVARFLDGVTLAAALRSAGLVFFGFVAVAAVAGQDLVTNPTFGVVYVWLWVGIVPTSLLFGLFFKAVSPARTIHLLMMKALRGDPAVGLRVYPTWLGTWPAAAGLLAFVWLELVSPDSTYLGPVRLWFAIYFAIMLVGGAVFGSTWFERADPFEVYSTLVGHLSIFGRRPDGALVIRAPMRNLAEISARVGLVAVVAVLLGSTAFDSFRSSRSWVQFSQSTTADITLINTTLLVGACSIVGVTFVVATMATGVDTTMRRRDLPATFAHSLVPIVVGYMIAHYLTFFVEVGQQTLAQISDPLGNGANLFGTAGWQPNFWLSLHPSMLASIKVASIVTGHVLGVIAAHDRALSVLPRQHQVTGQLPLLAAMTLYTFAGLYLLFGL
ncbi:MULTISPECIES: hypothetical protein [unclassified Nocardioides]|uniref:hypothetical protein n=1 Tax=unclassified Nocardioides TaxID=2615069 RepID=UPI0009F0F1DF|nr:MULTISPECIES: hypothetical protein [unclassified Nocardioides]GAW49774.1 Putative uncharacterized protein [Nocardioides sp. PD653-B2]GAW56486.1 putative uncharacterized protein [Nocardioides sp. PD653]